MGETSRQYRQGLIARERKTLSVRRQCELLAINRSTLYTHGKTQTIDDVELLNRIQDVWLSYPFYGYRRITKELRASGLLVNRKRVQRLMAKAGIQAIFPGPNTSKRNKSHAVYPYLLRDLAIEKTNQVWQVDITYLRMQQGFMYLVALIDVYSRYIVGWSVSNTMDTSFCIEALNMGLARSIPEIVNSDQGCQFTSDAWIGALKEKQINISMTGKGRCLDNIYIERFWRSFKREEFYLTDYEHVGMLKKAIADYIAFYNNKRWHQSLDYKRPADVYFDNVGDEKIVGMWCCSLEQLAPLYPQTQ